MKNDLDLFKEEFAKEINQYALSEKQIVYFYQMYKEDPFQFTPEMINPEEGK